MLSYALRFLYILLALSLGMSAGSQRISVHASSLSGTWQVLGTDHTLPTLYRPAGLATDAGGNLYVADSGNFRIVEIGPRGQVLVHFGDAYLRPDPGTPSQPKGQEVAGPRSLAVSATGTVYVADAFHRSIRVFSSRHHLIGTWPVRVPGSIVRQLAVAVGARGNIVVAIAAQVTCTVQLRPSYCATYYVVQRRSPSGGVLSQFHSAIGRSGQVASPKIISQIATAVDTRGYIYVATGGVTACYKDCPSFHFLVKYGSGGKALATWGAEELDVSANWPAIAIGGHGNIFLADDFNHRIEKRSLSGRVDARSSFGSVFPLLTSGPSGIALDRQGDIYVSDPGSGRILSLSPNDKLRAQWGTGGSQAGRFWFPGNLALDVHGRLWVNDAINGRVQMLGTDGRFHVQFSVAHVGPAMGIDHPGNIYLAQLSGRVYSQVLYISTFSPSGTLRTRSDPLPVNVLALGVVEPPTGIAVAPNGDIFVAGSFCFHTACGSDIVRLSPAGHVLGEFSISSESTGSGLAVDVHENVYTTYGSTPRFEKWSLDGVLLASWGVSKPEFAFPSPAAFALDSVGNIYVADTPQNRIEKFGPNGTLLGTWGVRGSYPGQFHHPGGIAVGSNGSIYVADTDNHRIQKLTR